MEKINFRFLNYKKYDTFTRDLSQGKVREDAIVFIQDKLRIWARGKEYVCDGSLIPDASQSSITFKNNTDDTILTLSQQDGTITFRDGNGDEITGTYTLKSEFDSTIQDVIQRINQTAYIVNSGLENLAKVARTGSYLDLDDLPSLSFVESNTYTAAMAGKQNKLTAVSPVYIDNNNRIGVNIDNKLYIIVDDLQTVQDPNPDKIYLLETSDENQNTIYLQYRYKNGQWAQIGQMQAEVDLSEYTPLSRTEAIENSLANYVDYSFLHDNYQPKGVYAYRAWVEEQFVNKADVYTINNTGDSQSSQPSDPVTPSPTTYREVDDELSILSINPVENRTITRALQEKADRTELPSAINNVIRSTFITISVSQYQLLVDNNLVDPNIYYFTYEDEENGWVFGDKFPVILSEETTWGFGDRFPVILTNGTAEGLGEFPINLT